MSDRPSDRGAPTPAVTLWGRDVIEPEQYLDEVLRLLPYWPKERYLELAPKNWQNTRAKLDQTELSAPLCSFTIPEA